jgi:hypothetical protein
LAVRPVHVERCPFGSLAWTAATAYGANADPAIWASANGGPTAGIDNNAQWVWAADSIWEQHGFVKAAFTAPVPLPAAGLVGLVAMWRKGR